MIFSHIHIYEEMVAMKAIAMMTQNLKETGLEENWDQDLGNEERRWLQGAHDHLRKKNSKLQALLCSKLDSKNDQG